MQHKNPNIAAVYLVRIWDRNNAMHEICVANAECMHRAVIIINARTSEPPAL